MHPRPHPICNAPAPPRPGARVRRLLSGRPAAAVAAFMAMTMAASPHAPAQSEERVDSRIDHLESLYQQRTAQDRDPLLKQYIEDLSKLQETLISQSRLESARAVEQEIERAREAVNLGTELALPVDEETLVDAEDLEAVAAYRRPLQDDAYVLVMPGGFTTSIATTWGRLRESPSLMGDQTASLGSRAWTGTQLPAGDYEVVAALRSRADTIGGRLTARIGSAATASRTVRGVVRNPQDDPLVFFNMGTITIEETLDGFPIEVEARTRRTRDEGGRPVALLALILIAHGSDPADDPDADGTDGAERPMRRPAFGDDPDPLGNGGEVPIPNPFANPG